MKKIGLTIGKFAPLHKGHEYLIEQAIKQVDKLYILIYETDLIHIDIKQREEWIKSIFKDDKVITIQAINPPRRYGMDKESIAIQLEYIKKVLEEERIEGITHFFSSEEYGIYVARMLNAENVIVDKERINIHIKATDIRENLEEHKEYLSEKVYKELIK